MSGLEVRDVTVRFGGHLALDAVSLHAPRDRITGLIGPNGAGKTTLFNACSGNLQQTSGTIRYEGQDLSRSGPARRAQAGLGRTFQRLELYDSMTVSENVALGAEAALAGRHVWAQLRAGKRDRRAISERAEAAMDQCGIAHMAAHAVRDLPTGSRRLVEVARALAGPFTLLLLDEPSSGLDHRETDRFAELLQGVVESGIGVLLVEHDIALVRAICDYLYVLDFGQLIYDGSLDDVLSADVVKAAYLGSEVA